MTAKRITLLSADERKHKVRTPARQWIVDFGLPGPGRGAGGRLLLVPPGYNGPLADSGHSRTTRAFLLGRAFMEDDGLRRRADHR